jgi:DNA-directed RNA polymerase specialized sigma24 family protein
MDPHGMSEPTQADPVADRRAALLRAAVECDHAVLCRRVGALVYRLCGPLRRDEVADVVQEVLNEAVGRALRAAGRFEEGRSVTAWLIGIALRVLHERRRSRAAGPVSGTDLGGAAWREALEALCVGPGDEVAAVRLDVRQALARLAPADRTLIEKRYFEGLDGDELARATGAPNSGAARVRLCRALQRLRPLLCDSDGRRVQP